MGGALTLQVPAAHTVCTHSLKLACMCSQAVARQDSESFSVWLGPLASQPQAQLEGFKSRALRVEAQEHRHMYCTEWRTLDDERLSVSRASPTAQPGDAVMSILVLCDTLPLSKAI